MKAYRVVVVIIDFDRLGGNEIKDVLENTRYPNHCIAPRVMACDEADIGEWSDDHPLNFRDADMLAPFRPAPTEEETP